MPTPKEPDPEMAKSAYELFMRGLSSQEVREKLTWDGRKHGPLKQVQELALKDFDPKKAAAGLLLRADRLANFGKRAAPADLKASQLSILSICDGQMNGERRFA